MKGKHAKSLAIPKRLRTREIYGEQKNNLIFSEDEEIFQ